MRKQASERKAKSEMRPTQRKRIRVMRTLRKHGSRAKAAASNVNTTLGDLIAAAFDAVGNEAKAVGALISSSNMRRAIGKRIVLT